METQNGEQGAGQAPAAFSESEKKVAGGLMWWSIGLAAVIVFGLLWFFLIAPANPSGSAGWFLFSFAAGLTMIVLPCTLPLAFVIVPLSMGKGMVKGIGMALSFGLGVAITLSLYGVAAALVGKAAIETLGAPLETVKNWVYFIAGIFAYLFALGSIGLFKFKMPTYTGAAPKMIQEKQDYLKALLMGLFLGNIGVGCPHPATPLILIEIASSGDILYGWLLFLVHAVGRVLPLLLLAFLGVMGVNGLSWLVARREKVEHATGWAMVFVAGFILVLGLFTHDWWVNSGQHTLLEQITQEEKFLDQIGENLGTENVHRHGLEEGTGLFGLPLGLGNWVLVLLWALPFYWYYKKERERVGSIPDADQVTEKSAEAKTLRMRRNFYIALILALGLLFIYILPMRFYWQAMQGGHDSGAASVPAAPFSRDIAGLPDALPTETVLIPDGGVYDLAAFYVAKTIDGKKVRMIGYNGMIPGPLIKVAQGSEITVRFTNKIDIPTTIHSHGVRLDNRFDGVAGVTQDAVLPGETFEYTVEFPDAGIYWYHPHMREDYSQELGLYGNYLVEGDLQENWAPVNREIPVFLDDIALDQGGDIAIFDRNLTTHSLMGRFGTRMFVNGTADFSMDVDQGEVIRFYLTDSANTRSFHVGFEGARMKLVGSDIGAYESEEFVQDILLSPAERAVVDVLFENPGEYMFTHTTPDRTYLLGVIRVSDTPVSPSYKKEFEELRTHPLGISDEDMRRYLTASPDKSLRLTGSVGEGAMEGMDMEGMDMEGMDMEGMDMDHGAQGRSLLRAEDVYANGMPLENAAKIEWEDNPVHGNPGTSDKNVFWKIVDDETGRANMDIDWTFKKGDMVKVRIFNDPKSMHPMQHPIHFHGQRFLVLATNGVENENKAWKDTMLVPRGDTVDILVEMSNPGVWMAHCHIAEHLHSGMMFNFRVEGEDGTAPGDEYRESVGFVWPPKNSAAAARGMSREAPAGMHMMPDGTMMPMMDAMMPAAFDESQPHGHEDGVSVPLGMDSNVHMHDDGSTHDHSAAPRGGAKAMLVIVSLLITGILSRWVWKYLQKT